MSKKDQVLIVDPQSELKFKGPFTQMSVSYINLQNPTDKLICFKIKTTAPKKYCVRPNTGFLQPQGEAKIQVCLQPSDYEPNERYKHKFMVQSVICPPHINENSNMDNWWKDVKPEELMDTKLRCVLEHPSNLGLIKSYNSGSEGSNTNDETKLVSGDSAPNSPEGKAKSKDSKLSEEDEVRSENIRLKEMLLVFEKRMASETRDIMKSTQPIQYSQQSQTQLIIIAIVTGLLGIILGKFLL